MRAIYLLIFVLLVSFIIFSVFYFFKKENKIETKLDKSFCNEIEFKPLNDVCHIAFSKDIASCQSVEKGYDMLCYEIVIESMKVSRNICESMENQYVKFLCNKKLAIKLEDPEFCEGNFNCYTELASSTGDENVCNYIDFDQDKYMCLAKVSKNRNYCDYIEDEIERINCIAVIPEEIGDCKIEEYNYINFDCLSELAYKNKDSKICNLISLEELKWTCIINVEDDPKVCDNAPDFFKDICKIEYLKNHIKI